MIPVQNVYYMLSYAFKVLNEQGYKRIATEEFNNTAELMAAILAKGIAVQLKRGLGKEYIKFCDVAISAKQDIRHPVGCSCHLLAKHFQGYFFGTFND